jgi:hypothetical protein
MSAYTWFQLVILFVFAAVLLLFLGAAIDSIGGTFYNTTEVKDVTTDRSMAVTNNATSGFIMLPIIIIIGIAVKALVAASNTRSTGRPGNIQIFGAGLFLMILLFTVAFLMAILGGVFVDELEDKILNPDSVMSKGLSADWQAAQVQSTEFFNIVNFIPLFIQCLGVVLYFQGIFKDTSGDYYAATY